MQKFIGVDPGATGGLASITGPRSLSSDLVTTSLSSFSTLHQLYDWFILQSEGFEIGDVRAVIEKVSGYIGTPHPGNHMFNFGASYGRLQAFLVAAAIPFEEVVPKVWQASLGVSFRRPGDGQSKSEYKAKLQRYAQNLFPRNRITLATADAVLLAEYCRRKYATVNQA